MTDFKYAFDNKRYHTWNYYLRSNFGEKVFKVSINAGFSCPNIDGTITYGGCTYCSKEGSGDFAGNPNDNLIKQFEDIKQMMHKKWHSAKYIGYFQAFTNTHAPVNILKEKYETILNLEDVIGLSISTRPDCLPDDVVEYLAKLNKKTNLWVELGLQTIHDKTSKVINRGHDYDTFLEGVEKLKKHNIKTVVHIINGLPGEDYNMMMETAKAVSELGVHGIKIHLLHVLKNTPMEKMLEKEMFTLMEKDEYVNLVCDQLEILPPEMVVHRLTGDGKRDEMVGPMWSLKKWEVLNAIDDTMKKRNSYQGIKYNKKNNA
ncbi:radical SAM protein [[Clostridium] sordellii]|uniref:Oxidoreductase, Fe-S subunit n=1 Tax=Paraclostridium sordellii TaxID=1505 RepID=A0A9P1L3I9_PARSO|nr:MULTISPECIES: TIGR01212 family radical SAM protein [Paeniclostridium]EPZ57636.1 radical SAM superfamily protein [[Clostridium] sordellii VPI 9048] [Paeniclostridium sordellii VPI 9048]MBW4861931.1 TIGR01212 family radical SAM protein [Paeniclostridium sp.]MBW4874158.1 TIGR01212 family radical SAM protein [Paeniclostridium sp.]MCQ4696412.1 TIGR01212 family radical SAM protein [Paeniclostridium sordellii]MCR1848699.1 TIGR01212 family radical SAM protein [Paeniclostridium sordellii]